MCISKPNCSASEMSTQTRALLWICRNVNYSLITGTARSRATLRLGVEGEGGGGHSMWGRGLKTLYQLFIIFKTFERGGGGGVSPPSSAVSVLVRYSKSIQID